MMLVALAVPGTASAETNGDVVRHDVDARGCIRPPRTAGQLVSSRLPALAGASVFMSDLASNACVKPDPRTQAFDPVWRSGWTMIAPRTAPGPSRAVDIQVRRLPIDAESSWLITRVGDRELRVQHEVDQCSPSAWFRVVETDTEVRLRYFRPKHRTGSCTLVLFSHWQSERVVRLRAPLGRRRIVAELGAIPAPWIDDHCPWYGSSINALIHGANGTQREALADAMPDESFSIQEWRWAVVLRTALRSGDAGERAFVGRGVRRDMRRLAYPQTCTRDLVLPAVTSHGPTRFVLGGTFDDADLVGVDSNGAVTWATHLDSSFVAIDVCPEAQRALVVDRLPNSTWTSQIRLRTAFVDLADGTIEPFHGIRAYTDLDSPDDVWASPVCTSGTNRTGRLTSGTYVWDGSQRTFEDEIWSGGSRRIMPPSSTNGVVGDGFRIYQTKEPVHEDDYENIPGRLVRVDLATGAKVEGPLLSRQALLSLSPDGHTLVTAHGPVRLWDVSSGIRFLASFPDPHPGQENHTGLWAEDGDFIFQETPVDQPLDMDPSDGLTPQNTYLFRVSPASMTMSPLATIKDPHHWLQLEDGGRLFTYDPWGIGEEPGGLLVANLGAGTWDSFTPALADGWLTQAAVVRPQAG
jgi:hypothetical protein